MNYLFCLKFVLYVDSHDKNSSHSPRKQTPDEHRQFYFGGENEREMRNRESSRSRDQNDGSMVRSVSRLFFITVFFVLILDFL